MKAINLAAIILMLAIRGLCQDSLLQKANDLYIQQDYVAAAAIYSDVYKTDTTNIEPAIKCANSLYLSGNFKQAKSYLNILFESTLDTFSCYKVYSKIYESDDNIPMAIKAYRYLILKDSQNLSFKKNLARIYMNNRLYSDARATYKIILNQNQEDISSAINLAEAYINLKENSQAGKIIDQVLSRDSTNINARKMRARIFYDIKAYKEVVEDLSYINRVSDMAEYYYNMLGVSYMYIDSFDLAEQYLIKSFSVKDYKEYGYYYLATMAEKKGDIEKAKNNYALAIVEGISDFTDIYYKRLAEIYLEINDYDNAIKNFEKASSFKEKPEYIYFIALSNDYKVDAEKAIQMYKKYCEVTASIEGKYLAKAKERIAYLEDYLKLKKLP